MMARWHEKLFPVLEELNIGFVAFEEEKNATVAQISLAWMVDKKP